MAEIEQIASRDNRRLVHARKVRDGKVDGEIFIEGRRLVSEALRSDIRGLACFVDDNLSNSDLADDVRSAGIETFRVSDGIFKSFTDTVHSQGVVLTAERPETGITVLTAACRVGRIPLIILLHEIGNPSNLGAIIRTAEAAGVAGVIVSELSADVFSPKSIRASMGSAFRMPIWDAVSLEDVVAWAASQTLITTAAVLSGEKSYTDVDWSVPRLLVFGSEAHGLSGKAANAVDETITILMASEVESLNLAASAAIIMFEAKRQTTDRSI